MERSNSASTNVTAEQSFLELFDERLKVVSQRLEGVCDQLEVRLNHFDIDPRLTSASTSHEAVDSNKQTLLKYRLNQRLDALSAVAKELEQQVERLNNML